MQLAVPESAGSSPKAAGESNTWLSILLVGGVLALLGAIATGLLWPMVGKPYVYDEVSFIQMAEAIAEKGVPYANVGFMIDRGILDRQSQFGLWHPPMYLYSLGLAIKLFGSSEQTSRLFGIFCMMLTALFVYLTVRTALREHPYATGLGLWAAILYVINPLSLQSALVLDIDGTVLTVMLMALVWCYLKASEWGFAGRLATGALFGVALFAKMTTPFFVLPAIVAYRMLQGRLDRGLGEVVTIGAVGAGLFLIGWRLATAILHMPFEMPFEVLYAEFHDATGYGLRSLRTFEALAGAAQPALRWFGPFLPILLVIATIVRAFDHLRFGFAAAADWLVQFSARIVPKRDTRPAPPAPVATRRDAADGLSSGQALDLLIVLSWIILVVYLIKTAAEFPKYHIAAVPPMAAVAALLAGRAFTKLSVLEVFLHPVAVAGLVYYFFHEVGQEYFDKWNYDFIGPTLRTPALFLVPVLVIGVIAGRRILPQLVLLPALASIAWTVPAVYAQSLSPYSTNYFYGSGGAFEIAQVAKQTLGPDEFYLSSKDVAYYLPNKNYVDQDSFWWLLNIDKQKFTGDWYGRPIRVIIIFGRDPFLREQFYAEFGSRYEVREVIGDFALLTRVPGR